MTARIPQDIEVDVMLKQDVFNRAAELVAPLVLEHGLETVVQTTALVSTSKFPPVDQHINHILEVANWLLEPI